MNTENTLEQAAARINNRSKSSRATRAIAGFADVKASGEAATKVANSVAAMLGGGMARDAAASMLRQGKSPVEVWDALVSAGVEPGAAEALMKELLDMPRQVGIGAKNNRTQTRGGQVFLLSLLAFTMLFTLVVALSL